MDVKYLLAGVAAVVVGGATSAMAATYQVGTGQTYATIQAAVNAAAAADVGSSAPNTPNPSPVNIVVHGGTYNEYVNIPADPSNVLDGLNDGWTIQANPGDHVLLNGGFDFGQDRDTCTINGINIQWGVGGSALRFNQTTRNELFENAVIYGGVAGNAAISGSSLYGGNTLNHVTIYGADYGISVGYASSVDVTNSIVAFGAHQGFYSSNGSSISYSDFYGNNPNYGGGNSDGGGNLNYPNGVDPMFVSTDPNSPYFLWLQAGSPASGTASDGGNMGARPTLVPEPASMALLAMGGLALRRRRRRRV